MSKEFDIELDTIKRAVERAASRLGLYIDGKEPSNKTLYSALSARFPLYTDDNIPSAVKQHLKQVDTCACADDKHIYLSSSQLLDILKRASESIEIDKYCVLEDVESLIVHEYTHILMQHLRQLNKFQRQSKNAKNAKTFSLACEIEANRGYCIRRGSNIYKMGVTEDAFPEVQGVYGLHNIYEALKKAHKDDIDEHMNSQKQQGGKSDEGDEDSEDSKEESKQSSLNEAQKQALDRLKKEFDEQEEEAKKLPDESDDESEEGGENAIAGGGANREEAYTGQNAEKLLRAYNSKQNQTIIKQDLSRLKGILSGSDVSVGRQKTYSRPSRRDGEGNLMKKGVKKGHHNAPKVLIGMDSSGSMECTTMQQVLNSISDIIKATGREMKGSYICEHDHMIRHLEPLYKYKEVVKYYRADGGNDFNALLRTALNTGVECVINVGDGWDELSDRVLMKQAKARNIKWFDVIISNRVEKFEIEQIVEREEGYFGDDYIGRTVLKLR